MHPFLSQALDQAALLLPRIGMGLLVFAGFWLASLAVKKVILRGALTARFHKTFIVRLTARLATWGTLVFGAVTALGTMGINVSALVAGLGLTGFALGFALKDIVSNVVAGILLLVYQPFQVGDYITVAGTEGTVADIDLRYTTLHKDAVTHLLPNAVLFTNNITLLRRRPEAMAS